MRERTATCAGCGRPFRLNPVGRPWTRCDDCVPPKIASQRSRRVATPPPSSIPCDDCGGPVSQTRPIEGVETLCKDCSGLESVARRFPCSGCGCRFVRRHRGGPKTTYVVRWLCDECEQRLKWCRTCDSVKPLEEFSRQSGRRVSRVSRCRPCLGVVYQQSDKVRASALKFGLTEDQQAALYEEYGHACAVCGRPADASSSRTKKLAIDHDHRCCPGQRSCGRCVRGVLCMNCNVGIGNLGDDPERLMAAVEYLKSYQEARLRDP